jgi:hypothetical protein
MVNETARRDEDIHVEAIARWNNEGGAPGPLKGVPVTLRQKLAASVSYDLWRFSCEMPDAPHLSEARLNQRGEEQSKGVVPKLNGKIPPEAETPDQYYDLGCGATTTP